MAFFRYQAFDLKGAVVSGQAEFESEVELKDSLRAQNLMVFKIERVVSGSGVLDKLLSLLEPSVTTKTKIQFTNQLSILLKSGIPLIDAMDLLQQQFEGAFKKVLNRIIEDLKEGAALSDALAKNPKYFSNVFIQLVRAGEASGKLELVLDRMTSFLERSEEIDASIKAALSKPIYNLAVVLLGFVAAVVFVIPQIASTMGSMGGKPLPALTLGLMSFSAFLSAHWMIILAILIGLVVAFVKYINSAQGELAWHSLLLRTPVVSRLTKNKAVVQFSQTLGMLMDAGVKLSLALEIVSMIVENAVLRSALKTAREEIIKEGKVAKHLKNTNIFSPVANYMISTGDESGQLAQMLVKIGVDSELELRESINAFVFAIDPIMLLITVGLFLILAAAMFMPIMDISSASL